MRTIATLILFLFIGIQFSSAQEEATQTQEKTFSWNETTHDFGNIEKGTPAPVTFTVTNNGTAPLIISTARSSCGCTVAEYTKEPIKPNETGIVKATYNAAKPGSFTKSVTVTFDGVPSSEVLRIKGIVVAKSTDKPATQPAKK